MVKVVKTVALVALLAPALYSVEVVNINKDLITKDRIAKEDLAKKKVISEELLGLRKTDLYSEKDDTVSIKTNYNTDAPGTSKRLERAFQDAPPMIPHSVEGLLPIKRGNNQCLSCHMPEVAPSMKATPIPKSHFVNFRPKHKFDGKMFKKAIDDTKNEVSISDLGDKLSMARFNCSQCHAPQSRGDLVVANTFEGGFSDKDGKSASHWYDRMTDDLATVGEKDSIVTEKDLKNENSLAGSLNTH